MTSKRIASIELQIADLTDRRAALHAEMTSGLTGRVDSTWFADRVNEMAYLNRSLDRLRGTLATLELATA